MSPNDKPPPINLQPFCSTETWRYNIHKPFSRGDYSWATNGHILIRIPRRNDIPENPDAPNVEKVFADGWHDVSMRPLNTAALPPVTSESEICQACDGRGTDHDCSDCKCGCDECDGSGTCVTTSDDKKSVSIGAVPFMVNKIRKLQPLEDVCIEVAPEKNRPLSFSFAGGGAGLLMPLRERERDHLDIAI